MSQKISKIDYSKGLIYKLCCKDATTEDIYIGSTTNFINRKHQHKGNCNNSNREKYNLKVYKFIRENGGFENWDMILIQYYSCVTKKELEAKEREYIEKLKPSLNCQLPGRTKKEWAEDNIEKIKEQQKNWHNNNRDKFKQHLKQYYEKNKTEISEKLKIKIQCEYCKSVVRKADLNRHQKTNKCLKFQV